MQGEERRGEERKGSLLQPACLYYRGLVDEVVASRLPVKRCRATFLSKRMQRRFVFSSSTEALRVFPQQKIFQISGTLMFLYSKLKLYWSIVRPTVTHGCETWVLKETIRNK
jgi:hypothetical protein